MSCEERPELSVIVPVFHEEQNLPPLFDTIAAQRSVRLELILSDGGSADRTIERAEELSARFPFPVRTVTGGKGRAAQMNRAARLARADRLLFLHADSSFPDPFAFRTALDAVAAAEEAGLPSPVAGRFSLEFDFSGETPPPYRFYESKARLDRPGCTHGDQGFLMSAQSFGQAGPYDETLPCMEDTLLAERIRSSGSWILFHCRIRTSPRRFVSEGLLRRQALNAILMNLAALGRLDLIRRLAGSYRSQDRTGKLRLHPLFTSIIRGVAELPRAGRVRFWYDTGNYIRANAWQCAFFLDHLTGCVEEGKGGRFLALYDRFLERWTDNVAGRSAAAALGWLWFQLTAMAMRRER